ncbi:MAG: prepilin-type N-terminal cleavage/methylation domain-containing protein [Candidatus Omnitrophota bacterium]
MMKIRSLKRKGFSLVEVLVVTLILAAIIAGGYTILASGESAWFTTDANIYLSENLRQTVQRISAELRESGSNSLGVMQVSINDGAGVNGTDILRFSVPIVCEAGGTVISSSGDVNHWGAPLTWGCDSPSCMDADNDCSSIDYRYVEYQINANNDLLRRVLDNSGSVVREDIFAQGIVDFQVSLSADQNVVTLICSAQKVSALSRVMSASRTAQVYLRNRG